MGGALEARHVDASQGKLWCDVRGDVEKVEGVLVIRRIHAVFHLRAREEARDVVGRVHGSFIRRCPVYRSIQGSIEVTTELVLEEG